MNSIKYRKWYLTQNWKENKFIMIKEKINVPRCLPCPYSVNFQTVHPKVLSGEAYWISHNELCIGYYSSIDPDVFRPIFSYTRQILLDKVHHGKKEDDEDYDEEDNYSIIDPNLRYARKKYLVAIDEHVICSDNKKIPIDCVKIILSFISNKL